jgi:3'-phosphoadenosine 5'-phosphosulfate sulfotransferase (PAPS reductase)/FAD synthetase
MSENVFEKSDLIKMINEPLPMQYQRIQAKIMEAIAWTEGDIVICFSGGKDSALILDMYCEIISKLFPRLSVNPIKVAWANTTNETLAMQKYVKSFIEYCETKYNVTIDFTEVKPANNDNIITVMKREGLPFISKTVASTLRKMRNSMEENNVTYDDIKHLQKPTIQCRDALREMGLNDTTVMAMTGWSCQRNDFGTAFVLPIKWMPLLRIKDVTGCDIKFSERCCHYVKKEPIGRLNYPNVMTGEQAVESRNREYAWMKTGCNYKLPDNSLKSKPLGAVSLDAVLYALHYRQTPLSPDYGKVEYCDKTQCYKCSKSQRTGCALCGFGIKYDPQRFVRLQETEPSKIQYAFKPFNQGGLGYMEVCEFLNEYCGTKIVIPEVSK